ncbi:hypothetical protein [uncultured Thiodictyon sp.]|uniref:hypothetical protein n=1 Tax=uncultured Thiodictyon sp. TaxID=1846217 RepID=UPI0025CDE2BE|nr:hypothetical protein [uncultured Thiodictyon sp.]
MPIPVDPNVRMQLLIPQSLKSDVEAFADQHNMSANEAMRILVRRGMTVEGERFSAVHLLDEFSFQVRELAALAALSKNR